MRAAVAVLALALCLALVPRPAAARFLTDRELEDQTCSSTVHQTVAKVRVGNPPTGFIDILRYPSSATKFRVECLEVFESLTNAALLSPALTRSCSASNPTMRICQAPDNNVPDNEADWTCTDLTQYLRAPRTETTYGDFGGPRFRYKFQWRTGLTNVQCFPRDLTVQLVAYDMQQQGASVAASVIFILIVVFVGIGIIIFGVYQVRKSVTSQFKRGELERGGPVDGPGDMPGDVDRALGIEDHNGGAEATLDLYDEAPPVVATVTDNNEYLESKPLPKPWYERRNYDRNAAKAETIDGDDGTVYTGGGHQHHHARNGGSSNARRQLDYRASESPVDRHGRVQPQQHRASSVYEEEPAGGHGRNSGLRNAGRMAGGGGSHYDANSLREEATYLDDDEYDEDDEEMELACADCMLPIKDRNTPQMCEVTGKRHY